MNTLVIHPEDRTTDFLKPIYNNLKNTTIITGGLTLQKVHDLIESHDRCFFLGHGTPLGLLSVFRFINSGVFIVNSNMVSSLINKTENMYIWCYAKSFVEGHNLQGLYTDMFVSEVAEAEYHGFTNVSQSEITESNDVFSDIIGRNIHKSKEEIYDIVKTEYGRFGNTNRIGKYNSKRIFIR